VTGPWLERWGPVVAWCGVASGALLWALAIVLGVRRPATSEPLLVSDVVWAVSFGGFLVVGGMLAGRKPRNPIGWCFVLGVGAIGLGVAASEYVLVDPTPPGAGWVGAVGQVSFVAGTLLLTGLWLALFPDGRVVGARWRWLPPALIVVGGLFALSQAALPVTEDGEVVVAPPPALAAMTSAGERLSSFTGPVVLALVVVAAASLVVRHRRGGVVERAQLRWLVWAMGLVGALLVVGAVADRLLGDGAGVGQLLHYLAFVSGTVGLSSAVAIAVTRYRLYDIDRLVSRSVSYAALTVLLLALYATTVLTLELVLRPHLRVTHDLVVAMSTLLVAAAFQPLRRRLQLAVDRRFDRRHVDRSAAVESYSRRLRAELDLQLATEDLRRYVHDLLAPATAGVLLLRDPLRRREEVDDGVAPGS
jgi:hypothetical protein